MADSEVFAIWVVMRYENGLFSIVKNGVVKIFLAKYLQMWKIFRNFAPDLWTTALLRFQRGKVHVLAAK